MKKIDVVEQFDLVVLAKLSGLSMNTLRNKCKAGKLKAIKIGKNWKLTEKEIKRFMEMGDANE